MDFYRAPFCEPAGGGQYKPENLGTITNLQIISILKLPQIVSEFVFNNFLYGFEFGRIEIVSLIKMLISSCLAIFV